MERLTRREFRLMIAVMTGQLDEVKELIDAGVNVNCADSQGITPILMAVAYDQPEIAALLIKNGADLLVSTVHGQTFLDYAWAFKRPWVHELSLPLTVAQQLPWFSAGNR